MVYSETTVFASFSHHFVNEIKLVFRNLGVFVEFHDQLRARFILVVVEVQQRNLSRCFLDKVAFLNSSICLSHSVYVFIEDCMRLAEIRVGLEVQ
jgi:hypothetical protein